MCNGNQQLFLELFFIVFYLGPLYLGFAFAIAYNLRPQCRTRVVFAHKLVMNKETVNHLNRPCVCVCVRACVRARARARVCVCVCVCANVCV